jgi:hypothetical protein
MPTSSNPEYPNLMGNLPTMKIIAGCITAESTTAVKRGKGFSVANPATGRYVLTLNRKPGHLVCAVGTLRKGTGSATFLTGPILDDTTSTVEFRLENASGTAADGPANSEIDFIIVVTRDKLPV